MKGTPRSVVAAKPVQLVLVTYHDEFGDQATCLAVVGENNVHLLDGKVTALSTTTTPSGRASEWMKEGVLKTLSKASK